jgi:hypothetical protein
VRALYILRDGRACPNSVVSDLSSLIVELSIKHFGTTSEVMVEEALQGADALVSVALIIASGRNQSDLKLSEILQSEGIRGVCGIFTQYVKEITREDTYYATPKLVLNAFFNLVSLNGWKAGYSELLRLHSDSKKEKNMVLVKDWLIRNTLQGRILHSKPTDDSHDPRQFIRRVLLQHCDLKDNIESEYDIDIESDGPNTIHIMVGPVKLKSAKRRFNDLISKMPLKLRLSLAPINGSCWFDENVVLKDKRPLKAEENAINDSSKKRTKTR